MAKLFKEVYRVAEAWRKVILTTPAAWVGWTAQIYGAD